MNIIMKIKDLLKEMWEFPSLSLDKGFRSPPVSPNDLPASQIVTSFQKVLTYLRGVDKQEKMRIYLNGDKITDITVEIDELRKVIKFTSYND